MPQVDDFAFELEKFRRDTQELLNATDELIATEDMDSDEGKRALAMILVRMISVSYTIKPLGNMLAERIK